MSKLQLSIYTKNLIYSDIHLTTLASSWCIRNLTNTFSYNFRNLLQWMFSYFHIGKYCTAHWNAFSIASCSENSCLSWLLPLVPSILALHKMLTLSLAWPWNQPSLLMHCFFLIGSFELSPVWRPPLRRNCYLRKLALIPFHIFFIFVNNNLIAVFMISLSFLHCYWLLS